MKVEALAHRSRPHYRRHLVPIIDALPPPRRGAIHGGNTGLAPHGGPVLIAGGHDIDSVPPARAIILVEHGAGQRYQGLDHPAYSGGRGRERVGLFLCPNETVAAANARRYPEATVAVVGCPALDRHHLSAPARPETVAVTFHFDPLLAARIPELRPAFAHYEAHLAAIVAELDRHGVTVIGHGHPRWGQAQRVWRRVGVDYLPDWDEVLATVGAVVVDNSSVGFEAAAVGRGVVWLNAPWYRRDVEHGLRFWEGAAVGHQADGPEEVTAAVLAALDGPADVERAARTYAQPGSAARAAAEAIEEWTAGAGW